MCLSGRLVLDFGQVRGYIPGMENRQLAAHWSVASLAVAAAVAISGCTASPEDSRATADPSLRPETTTASETPPKIWVQQYVTAGDQTVRWGDDISPHIILTTYGSGSCPTVPGTLEVVNETTLAVTLEPPPSSGACTDDLRPTAFAAEQPSGLDLTKQITLTIDGVPSGTLSPLNG